MMSIVMMAILNVCFISCSKDDDTQTEIPDNSDDEESIVEANIPIDNYYFEDQGLFFDGSIYYSILSESRKTVEVYGIEDDIKTLVIPDYARINGTKYAVTQIAAGVFKESVVESLTIGSNIKEIEEHAFGLDPFHSITVSQRNAIYDSRNNCNAIIETASNILIAGSSNTVIPEGVVEIGTSAFSGINIKSINLPNSVRIIGAHAFSFADLNAIKIPESVKNINEGAFEGSTLKSIILSSGITKIENDVFRDCKNLTDVTIPDNIESIGDGAFSGCI